MKRYIYSAEGLNSKQRAKIAETTTNPRELLRLANDNSAVVRREVARNRYTPAKALELLTDDEDRKVRICLAISSNTPAEILAQLANDEDSYVRHWVADNTNTPVEILAQLANDEDSQVRGEVAHHPNTPTEVLAQLANDKDEVVRYWTASNTNTSAETLAQLANDTNKWVRRNLSGNPNTPAKVLAQLANDEDEVVSPEALSKLPQPVDPSEPSQQLSSRKAPQNERPEKFTDEQYREEILSQLNSWIDDGYYGFIDGDTFVVALDDGDIAAGTIPQTIRECRKYYEDSYDNIHDIVWQGLPRVLPDFGRYDPYDKQRVKELFNRCGRKIPRGFWG